MAVCKGLKKDGSACNFRPAAGQEFCINHGGTKAEKKPPPVKLESGAAEKIAPKAAKPAPGARGDDGLGVGAGIAVGLACVAALAYFVYRRFWTTAPTAAAAPRPFLSAVP